VDNLQQLHIPGASAPIPAALPNALVLKFSTDPELDAKVRDVLGLYLNPPEKAVVVCIDEKTQIQALDRTAPILPMRPGLPEKATHNYLRHGTTSLFAALEVATGTVTDACYQRHTHAEFLDFLKLVAKAYPRVKLHVVADNYATHKHPKVKDWLAKHPRYHLHFTPTFVVVAEPGRTLVSGTDRQGHQTRRLPLRARPHRRNRGLHGGPQRQAQTLRLDCRRRRHPRQSSPRSRRPQPSSQSMMRHCTSCRRSRLNPITVPCRGSGCWCWALYGSDRVLLC